VLIAAPIVTCADDKPKIKDAESATHGSEAAGYEIVNTYEHPGFRVCSSICPCCRTIRTWSSAARTHSWWIRVAEHLAYLDFAKKEGSRIKGVFLTHTHARFRAGHTEMARPPRSPIYKNKAGGAQYEYKPLS